MSQHPEQRSTKSSNKSKGGRSDTARGGHGNARESGKKGGTTTHGRN